MTNLHLDAAGLTEMTADEARQTHGGYAAAILLLALLILTKCEIDRQAAEAAK